MDTDSHEFEQAAGKRGAQRIFRERDKRGRSSPPRIVADPDRRRGLQPAGREPAAACSAPGASRRAETCVAFPGLQGLQDPGSTAAGPRILANLRKAPRHRHPSSSTRRAGGRWGRVPLGVPPRGRRLRIRWGLKVKGKRLKKGAATASPLAVRWDSHRDVARAQKGTVTIRGWLIRQQPTYLPHASRRARRGARPGQLGQSASRAPTVGRTAARPKSRSSSHRDLSAKPPRAPRGRREEGLDTRLKWTGGQTYKKKKKIKKNKNTKKKKKHKKKKKKKNPKKIKKKKKKKNVPNGSARARPRPTELPTSTDHPVGKRGPVASARGEGDRAAAGTRGFRSYGRATSGSTSDAPLLRGRRFRIGGPANAVSTRAPDSWREWTANGSPRRPRPQPVTRPTPIAEQARARPLRQESGEARVEGRHREEAADCAPKSTLLVRVRLGRFGRAGTRGRLTSAQPCQFRRGARRACRPAGPARVGPRRDPRGRRCPCPGRGSRFLRASGTAGADRAVDGEGRGTGRSRRTRPRYALRGTARSTEIDQREQKGVEIARLACPIRRQGRGRTGADRGAPATLEDDNEISRDDSEGDDVRHLDQSGVYAGRPVLERGSPTCRTVTEAGGGGRAIRSPCRRGRRRPRSAYWRCPRAAAPRGSSGRRRKRPTTDEPAASAGRRGIRES